MFATVLYGERHTPSAARTILDSALALPVEYAADIAFDLLERNLIEDRSIRRETLERLYLLAGTARRRAPVKDAGAALGGTRDTVSGRTADASELHLDQQSIRIRAALLMLPLDQQRALLMFDEIPASPLDPIGCSAALQDDLTLYYTAMEKLFREGFSSAQRRRGDDVQFLRVHIGATTSIRQLVPALQMLLRLPFNPADRKELTDAVLRQLPSMTGSDREYSFAESQEQIGSQVHKLSLLLPPDDGSRKSLALAYRTFLLAHLSAKRCADNRTPGDAAIISRFNTQLLPFIGGESFRIGQDDVRSEFTLDRAKLEPLPYPDFHGDLSNLIKLSNSEETDWSSAAAKQVVRSVFDQVAAVGEREKTSHCGICLFFVHGSLDTLLISLLPNGQVDDVIDDFVRLLARSPFQTEMPAEWLSQLRFLLSAIRKITPDEQDAMVHLKQKGKILSILPSASRDTVLEIMRRSNNPILNVYALLEQEFPKSFQLPQPH